MREFFGGAKSAGFDWARVLNSVVPCRERSELWSLWRGISVEPPLNGAALHSAVTVDLQSQPFRAFLHHSKQADRFGFRPCSSCNAGTAAQAQQHRPASRSTLRTENCQSRTRGTVFCILFGTPHLPELTPADLNPSYPPSGIPPRTRQKHRHWHWHTKIQDEDCRVAKRSPLQFRGLPAHCRPAKAEQDAEPSRACKCAPCHERGPFPPPPSDNSPT